MLILFILLNFLSPYAKDDRAYLATYPRSGNGWVRRLIEDASGRITSSVYPEDHRSPRGGYCAKKESSFYKHPLVGQTVLMKTHFPEHRYNILDNLAYKVALRIIRHPVDSFYSYYCFTHPKPVDPVPSHIVKEYVRTWKIFNDYWNGKENVLTICYEDLYKEPKHYLVQMLKALDYPVVGNQVQKSIDQNPPSGGLFKYSHHFANSDLVYIDTQLDDLLKLYGYK